MNWLARSALSVVYGIMKLSDQSIPPESGTAKRTSGLDCVIWATSPDHANAAARFPLPRSFTYSLPLVPSILSSSNAASSLSNAGSALA